ncbi:hypothetical protein QMA74_14320 [Pantoea dispersa]|nr:MULTISPECIES: hypothetical protein [Pantoea]MDI6635441.1 hypothetical protein [Pantoea dispersa]
MAGGLNLYQHALISLNWIDPLGLTKCKDSLSKPETKH